MIDNSASQAAHAGAWKAWLDGYGTTHTDTLSQSVAIPAGCGATLTFYLHIDSAETTTSAQYDKLTVKAGSTTLATYSNLNKAAGYSQKSFNVSSFAGQTVTISFTGTEDSSLQTSFVIDDTALTLSCPGARARRPPPGNRWRPFRRVEDGAGVEISQFGPDDAEQLAAYVDGRRTPSGPSTRRGCTR